MPRLVFRRVTTAFLAILMFSVAAAAQAAKKPNILVIWGDDIGYWNVSAYNQGMMGYKTPNIDRIAKEGALFTDWYGEQSCTAGRSAFITGQSGFRTGNLKVGLPGAKEGLQARDVTLAQLLKAQGYMTAQFGKNHLGDADETLPTAHGFDEFMGSLYHLNAEQEPENPDYFKDPALMKKYGTRGVIHTWANPDGTQKIESTGPLTIKRMETIDEEVTKASLDYLEKAKKADKPFFLWWNSTRMHIFTHLKKESAGQDRPRRLSRRHGRARRAWSASCSTSSRSSASTRTPSSCTPPTTARRRCPGPTAARRRSAARRTPTGKAATACPAPSAGPASSSPAPISNDIFSHMDMLPTLMAAAGVPDVKEQLLKGMKVGDKTFKVHLDGYNITDSLAGKAPDPRHEFFYFNDDGSLVGAALRPVEDRLRRAARRGLRRLAGAVRDAAAPEDLQPALGSVREGRPRRHGLLPLADRSRLPARAGAAVRRAVPRHVQGIPAEPEGRQLQPRPGAEDAARRRSRQQVTLRWRNR